MTYPDCDNEFELCENFNKFFVEKIDKIMCDIDKTIKTENLTNLVDYEAECDSTCLEFSNFKSIMKEEVGKLIIKSKTTSCNLDPIPTDLVKKCMDVLLNPISDIVNSSLQEGSFPDSWKCAVATPLIKKKEWIWHTKVTGLLATFVSYPKLLKKQVSISMLIMWNVSINFQPRTLPIRNITAQRLY